MRIINNGYVSIGGRTIYSPSISNFLILEQVGDMAIQMSKIYVNKMIEVIENNLDIIHKLEKDLSSYLSAMVI